MMEQALMLPVLRWFFQERREHRCHQQSEAECKCEDWSGWLAGPWQICRERHVEYRLSSPTTQ